MKIALVGEKHHLFEGSDKSLCGINLNGNKLKDFQVGKNGVLWIDDIIGVWPCERCAKEQDKQ